MENEIVNLEEKGHEELVKGLNDLLVNFKFIIKTLEAFIGTFS